MRSARSFARVSVKSFEQDITSCVQRDAKDCGDEGYGGLHEREDEVYAASEA